MKKALSLLASFVLGFAFFMGGAAVAINASGTGAPDQLTEDQLSSSPTESSSSSDPQSTSEATGSSVPNATGDTYCFNIGKDNELDGDCFCVQDEVSDMAEVDCLIASGIVPASSRDGYLQELSLRDLGSNGSTTNSNPRSGPFGDVYCFNIGKDNELDGDCFCVQDEVSDMAEVDCLIASGIVPASSRDGYIQYLRSLESNP
jgi:hypothetical protein